MRKILLYSLIGMSVFIFILQGCRKLRTPVSPQTVSMTFADPALEAAIRNAISKPSGPITQSDLNSITYLNISSLGIADLSGLEDCRNLKVLYMWNNSVSDLTPLSGLTNLTDLYAMENNIISVAPLSNLLNLRNLDLDANNISDITAINANSSAGGIGNRNFDGLSLATDPLNAQSINTYIPDIAARTTNAVINTTTTEYGVVKVLDSTNTVVRTMTVLLYGGPYSLNVMACIGVKTGLVISMHLSAAGSLNWDGTDLSSALVPTGDYTIQAIIRTQTPSEQILFFPQSVTIINGDVCGSGNTCSYGTCSFTFP